MNKPNSTHIFDIDGNLIISQKDLFKHVQDLNLYIFQLEFKLEYKILMENVIKFIKK